MNVFDRLFQEEGKGSQEGTEAALQIRLIEWIQTPTWADARLFLRKHPELLSQKAGGMLHRLLAIQDDEAVRKTMAEHFALLCRCHEVGVETAFAEKMGISVDRAQAAEERYLRTGDRAALDESVAVWDQILGHPTLAAASERFRLAAWNDAGSVFLRRYRARGCPGDLDRALELLQAAVAATGADSPDRPIYLNNLGEALRARYARSKDPADLEAAMDAWEQAVAATGADSPDRPPILHNLGTGLRDRYALNGDLADLAAAIDAWEQVVAATPADSPYRAGRLNSLGTGLRTRYDRSQDPADLAAAINACKQAVAATSADSPAWPMYLNNLGNGLCDRYARNVDLADLAAAIDAYQQAVAATPADSPDRPMYLNNLGNALSDRYARSQDPADLAAAVDAWEQAVAATPADSPDRSSRLNNLGIGLSDRYARSGQMADLEAAIDAWEQAVAATGAESPDRPSILNNLGAGLRDRYAHNGDLADLAAAIDAWEQAVAGTPADSPDRPMYFNNLGAGLRTRFVRSRNPADLAAATNACEQAVAGTPPDSRAWPMYLNNLGNGLRIRYAHSRNPADLAATIDTYQQAVAATGADSPYRSSRLNNLGAGLSDRYARSKDPADLEAAIDAWTQAVAATGADSPDRPSILNNLGAGLSARYARSRNPADLEAAIEKYEFACQGGLDQALEIGLTAARTWGRWAVARRAWDEAVRATDYGRQAIERLYQTQLLRASRESWLREARGLHALAACALARLDQRREAAIAFEEGRARGMGEIMARDRADLEQVQARDPEAYDLYRRAVGRLRALEGRERQDRVMGAGSELALSPAVLTEEIRRARAELDQVLARIRQVSGYERFLLAPKFGEVAQAAMTDRPLVYLAATEVGSLALVLHREPTAADGEADVQVEAVWADGFSEAELEGVLVQREGDELTGGYLPGQIFPGGWLQTALEEGLPRLGEHLVGALASRLRALRVSRVVLVPTGRLGLLPLHAARYVVDGREMCLLDEFEVGYVPSARVLAEAQREERIRQGYGWHLAGVGNSLNNARPLAYARPELEEVTALFGGTGRRVLYEHQATKERLMAALPGATHVHLSCHGMFDPGEPLDSHLQLANEEPWTLREILGAECLAQARLVVLSACQTAITDFANLPDEVIGLPAGFLQAGVPGVVGTLWPVNDLSTMLLMVRFYRYHLRGDEATGEGPMAPAGALRRAQLWLRDVTCEELAELFHGFRQEARGETRMTYALAQRKFQDYRLRGMDEQPFAHPYYWAPFVFYGC